MISDVLYDTIDALDYYQSNYAATYTGYHGRISDLKAQMRQLAQDLDRPLEQGNPASVRRQSANGQVLPRHKKQSRDGLDFFLFLIVSLFFGWFAWLLAAMCCLEMHFGL